MTSKMPTTSASIEALSKDQTIVLSTLTEKHKILVKPLFNALQQHFPDASLETLKTLLLNNPAYGLHVAREHHLLAQQTRN